MEGKLMSNSDMGQGQEHRSGPARTEGFDGQRYLLAVLFTSCLALLLTSGPAHAAPMRDAVPGTTRPDIVDPCLGFRWRLIVDPSYPSRPGRLVRLDQNNRDDRSRGLSAHDLSLRETAAATSVLPLVIRAGARVVVDQETGAVRARLNAVALESAALGHRLRVRLVLGPGMGRNAEATSPGPVISVSATAAGVVSWSDPRPVVETVKERTN